MARWGKCDFKELEQFQEKLERASVQSDEFIRTLSRELAARLLAKVTKRTPVGVKPEIEGPKTIQVVGASGKTKSFLTAQAAAWSGYVGGTLRRGWVSKTEGEARSGKGSTVSAEQQKEYINGLAISKSGNEYQITIENPVGYAPYVEYGHRQTPGRYVPALGKRLTRSFVPGQNMLTISEAELEAQAPKLIEARIGQWLEEVLKDEK